MRCRMSRERALLYKGMRHRLKKLRKDRGLNPTALGRMAGLSRTAVSALEEGRSAPNVETIERLARALGISPAWLAFGDGATELSMNHRIEPGYDPLKLGRELTDLVNGCGGAIDQKYLYIDSIGAADWCALVSAYSTMPLAEVAMELIAQLDHHPISVIALGVGTGRHELELVNLLLDSDQQDIRLFLLDISQPLLSAARQSASLLLGNSGIPITAVEGDFYRLPNFMHFFDAADAVPRTRLACLFGATFGNLENEVRFVRNSLVGFSDGDLLLLEVSLAYASAGDRSQIVAKDPALLGQRPAEWQHRFENWLTGPIRRYAAGVSSIAIRPTLDLSSCSVPGSYAIDWRAAVKMGNQSTKEFSISFFKRYDAEKLADCLQHEGWERVRQWTYGDAFPKVLMLLRRHVSDRQGLDA